MIYYVVIIIGLVQLVCTLAHVPFFWHLIRVALMEHTVESITNEGVCLARFTEALLAGVPF